MGRICVCKTTGVCAQLTVCWARRWKGENERLSGALTDVGVCECVSACEEKVWGVFDEVLSGCWHSTHIDTRAHTHTHIFTDTLAFWRRACRYWSQTLFRLSTESEREKKRESEREVISLIFRGVNLNQNPKHFVTSHWSNFVFDPWLCPLTLHNIQPDEMTQGCNLLIPLLFFTWW